MRILVVGEGRFEYSQKLHKKYLEYDIYATSYETRQVLEEKGVSVPLSKHRYTVMTGIDASKLEDYFDPSEKFETIIFNNPHVKGPTEHNTAQLTSLLIQKFIESAKGRLREGGEIHIHVTQSLLRKYDLVREVFKVPPPGSARRFAHSPHYAGHFGDDTHYYVPYVPRYTKGGPIRFYWDPKNSKRLLKFVFK